MDMDIDRRMMPVRRTAYQLNEKDEYYTPSVLVQPIIQYIPKGSTVWCPFDTKDSEYVLMLREAGFTVVHSHIWDGKDFFEYEPDHFDCVVSNPPFSLKLQVLERLYSFKKPFALLMGLPILNHQEIGEYFLDKSLQLLVLDKKVSFNGKTASFNNSYFCYDFLPKDLMFVHLEHNNSGKNFVPSRMQANRDLVGS